MSLRDQNQALFEEASVPKALAAMAIPTIISQLITLIYNLADAFFVGRTGNPYMIAAVSLVFPVFAITVALSNLFGVGGGSLMSRCLGEGDEKSARQVRRLFPLWKPCRGPCFFPHPLFPAPPHLGSFRGIPCHLRLYGDLPFSCRHLRYPSDRPIRHLGPAFPKRRLCQKSKFWPFPRSHPQYYP